VETGWAGDHTQRMGQPVHEHDLLLSIVSYVGSPSDWWLAADVAPISETVGAEARSRDTLTTADRQTL